MEKKEIRKQIAINMICAYLNKTIKLENIHTIYAIQGGNKEVLYTHVKAVANIFNDVAKDLEDEMNEEREKNN